MKENIQNDKQDALFHFLIEQGYNFFVGVPDSSLKEFITLIDTTKQRHIRATWESEAVAIGFGAELTGKKSCVYLQNAGLGYALNTLTSLCILYNIFPLLIIGHRHTIPQHKVMGEIDQKLLEMINWPNYVLVDKSGE
jgi:sulfopyruvate decarboxylase TPP-binding subunit